MLDKSYMEIATQYSLHNSLCVCVCVCVCGWVGGRVWSISVSHFMCG
jgi:hypothetical protein